MTTIDLSQFSRLSLPGPDDILRVELPNGLTALSRANPSSPSVAVQGYLPAGSLLDSDAKLGLADFTASTLLRGSQRRSFQEIFELLESSGATLGFSGGTHTVSFYGKALAEDLDLLLTLLAEALQFPVFPQDYVERVRAQMLASLAIRDQDTAGVAGMLFDELLYPNHPYRRPDDGYPATIRSIERADLLSFHREAYGPHGAVIAVTGGIEPQLAIHRVAEMLGGWSNPEQRLPPELPAVEPLPGIIERRATLPGKFQADLQVGAVGPARSSPDFHAASLGNNILGQFGMMGRIGESVREKAGLAYYAGSSLSAGLGPGPWDVSAGVNPENIDQAVDLIRREIARFTSEPVGDDELADSQTNYIGRLPLSLESNSGVGSALLTLERYQLGLDYYRRYPDLVLAVTPAAILETARRYLDPDRLAIAIAGP